MNWRPHYTGIEIFEKEYRREKPKMYAQLYIQRQKGSKYPRFMRVGAFKRVFGVFIGHLNYFSGEGDGLEFFTNNAGLAFIIPWHLSPFKTKKNREYFKNPYARKFNRMFWTHRDPERWYGSNNPRNRLKVRIGFIAFHFRAPRFLDPYFNRVDERRWEKIEAEYDEAYNLQGSPYEDDLEDVPEYKEPRNR